MAGALDADLSRPSRAGPDGGLHRAHALGQLGQGEDHVDPPHLRKQGVELGERLAEEIRERGEHAQDLALLLADGLRQLVVVFDEAFRLHEQGRAALGAVVHDAAEPPLGRGHDRQHVAAVAHRDVALLEQRVGPWGLEEGLEAPDHITPRVPQPLADPAQRRARRVRDAAVLIERPVQHLPQRAERGQPEEPGSEIRGHAPDAPAVARESSCRLEKGEQAAQVHAIDHGARGTGAVKRWTHIGDDIPRRRAGRRQCETALAGVAEGRVDRSQVRRGLESKRPLPAHRSVGAQGQQGPHLGPLDPRTACDYSENRSRFLAFLRAARVLRFRLTLGFS